MGFLVALDGILRGTPTWKAAVAPNPAINVRSDNFMLFFYDVEWRGSLLISSDEVYGIVDDVEERSVVRFGFWFNAQRMIAKSRSRF